MEKIGIIGSGNMGRAVGVRLAQAGHSVFFGAREGGKAAEAAKAAGGAGSSGTGLSGTIDDAAAFGDVLLWTIRETEVGKVVSRPELLNGKIVMDLNNRDYQNEVRNGVWFGEAMAERLQKNVPGAHVVKVFNTLGMESFGIETEAMRKAGAQTFLAGADAEAKRRVAAIAETLGLTSIDLGSTAASFRAAEALGDAVRLLMIDGKRGGGAHLTLIALPEPTLEAIGKRETSNYA